MEQTVTLSKGAELDLSIRTLFNDPESTATIYSVLYDRITRGELERNEEGRVVIHIV
jgi:hypothetical protein